MNGLRARVRDALVAGARGLTLSLMGWVPSVALSVLAVVSISLYPLGIGALTTPSVLRMVRAYANRRRLLAARWAGIRIPAPYEPLPSPASGGLMGRVELTNQLLKDPATWRDLRWLSVDTIASAAVASLAPYLLLEGVFGILLAAGLWQPIVAANGDFWYEFVPVTGWASAFAAGAVGCVWTAVALRWNPVLIRTNFRITEAQLAPTAAELARRVEKLTETRRNAADASAAELRRIERDLHDGAQARLVAMGMDLGAIEMLLDKDPAKARQLLAHTRQSSVDALAELRDLVRGIHPPVLAERGLGDAVRALALRLPIATEVTVDLNGGRADAPVESAAYFAVSEILTNAAKHSGADRVWVDLHHTDGMLRIAVTDDGRGGAVIAAGSGLAGVERRLGTFDGVLAVSSPAGGPTLVTMEIPCALS
ncbi:sensor histidine kinase [Streptomyces yaanensis]|uniref:histidine kinase n=1 Tax=Streptomyces yaanensis TaxID=1142239 RepID=A0ABV7SK22_9ACTN|nr:sensor histidine kinase [Streptomyces sp. CGMCC 4.7035]WNC01463.1 sensor histidine kinase [Streptomyces sp. CGMCC 4.7035]